VIGGGTVDVSDVFVDFKDTELKGSDKELCEMVDELMAKSRGIIEQLDGFTDCGLAIRRALSNPTPENEEEAFNVVKRNVDTINNFYQFSKEIENVFPRLLASLASDDEKKAFEDHQPIAKKIAQVLDFVLKFDEIKMLRPGLQNDFSFYRRSLGKHAADPDLVVRDDEASFISLFIAQPIPMMTALAKATTELLNESPQNGLRVPKVLAMIANVCLHLVKSKQFPDDETNMLCVRAMVGSIVLYDHISSGGAFVKKSGINIRHAVQLVVKDFADCKPLVNALRYSTLHFSDESTPPAITALLESVP